MRRINTELITHLPLYSNVTESRQVHGCLYNFHEDRIANSKNHPNYVIHILIKKPYHGKKLYTNRFAIPDLRLANGRRGCCPAAYTQSKLAHVVAYSLSPVIYRSVAAVPLNLACVV